jgi:hypothetical protein
MLVQTLIIKKFLASYEPQRPITVFITTHYSSLHSNRLIQPTPSHPSYLSYLNIIIPSTSRSSKWPRPYCFLLSSQTNNFPRCENGSSQISSTLQYRGMKLAPKFVKQHALYHTTLAIIVQQPSLKFVRNWSSGLLRVYFTETRSNIPKYTELLP